MIRYLIDQEFPVLYKRGAKGEVRTWMMQIGVDGSNYAHRVVSGIVDGKLTRTGWTLCAAKNVGRSNATTSKTQAEAEVAADYTKKLDRGYFTDIEKIDEVKFTKPMLAQDWLKKGDKINLSLGVYVQPKLDGIRCIARHDGLWTRTGKSITSCDHVHQALSRVFAEDPELILDGELYNHDLHEDFNTITSIVRKTKVTDEDIGKAQRFIEYHVYDIIGEGNFGDRVKRLQDLLSRFSSVIRVVPTTFVTGKEKLDALYSEYLSEQYEGQIIRIDAGYENKRSNNLFKRKEFLSDEFEILRVEEGLGNWAGAVKRFVLKQDDSEFGAGSRGTYEDMAKLAERVKTDPPTWATVRYFTPTPDGVPRFPVVVDFGWKERDD